MYASYELNEVFTLRSMVGNQVVSPGRRISCGSWPETSTSSKSDETRQSDVNFITRLAEPRLELRAAATTASFSTGLREHVEYTIRPSGASIRMARCKMRT